MQQRVGMGRSDVVIAFVLGWLPDALVAFVVMKLTNDEWSTFWWVWLGIQVLYLLNWLKKTAWAWLVWRFWMRSRASSEAVTVLKSCNFPKPESDEHDIESFFTRLMEDDQQPVPIRIRAAEWRAAIHTGTSQGLQNALQVHRAWADALEAYRQAPV